MASRLLSALDARIAKCRDPVENACLRAEKAALLARQGYLDAARAELAIVHARYDGRPNAVVSAWVNLAEGLIAFYGSLSLKAKDKLWFEPEALGREAAHERADKRTQDVSVTNNQLTKRIAELEVEVRQLRDQVEKHQSLEALVQGGFPGQRS